MERDEALIISCRVSLFLFFVFFWWQKKNATFKISTCCQPLIVEFFWFACLWFRIEEKIHIKTVYDVSRGEEFWKLFCLGTNGSFGGKVCMGRARGWRKLCKLTIKWASSKTVSKDSANISCALPTGCFSTLYIELHYKKSIFLNISAKLVLKNLALTQRNPWKKLCSL